LLLFLVCCSLTIWNQRAAATTGRNLALSTDKTSMAVDLLETDPLVVTVSGFLANDVVRVGVYWDVNRNGVIDSNEPLAACYKLMDGQLPKIGGVRNGNVPGDEDGAVNGSISAILRGAAAGQLSAVEGDVMRRPTTGTIRCARHRLWI
jgi:hypothetical protein